MGAFPERTRFLLVCGAPLAACLSSVTLRAQFNRLLRAQRDALRAFAVYRAQHLAPGGVAYAALDCSGVPTRNAKRRGVGWLPGVADIGWSNRLGWYEGVHLLLAVTPNGIMTGFGFGAARTKDQPLAETFFALRQHLTAPVPSVGQDAAGPYVVDTGLEGPTNHARWAAAYHAHLICPPRRTSNRPWTTAWRCWHASIRHLGETVYATVQYTFRLARERPHDRTGLQARLAAKVALHNVCIWVNTQHRRPLLAFTDLMDW
jgi:hypothetical protein